MYVDSALPFKKDGQPIEFYLIFYSIRVSENPHKVGIDLIIDYDTTDIFDNNLYVSDAAITVTDKNGVILDTVPYLSERYSTYLRFKYPILQYKTDEFTLNYTYTRNDTKYTGSFPFTIKDDDIYPHYSRSDERVFLSDVYIRKMIRDHRQDKAELDAEIKALKASVVRLEAQNAA